MVSQDSVQLFFLLAVLNDPNVLACDIQNAYIKAATKEKIWFHGGDKMGSNKGKVIVIVHALYGLKSSGAWWQEHMAQTLQMDQKGLLNMVIKATSLENCNPNWTPASTLALGIDPQGPLMSETWVYPSIVCMLLYLATNTHPDISFVVTQVA